MATTEGCWYTGGKFYSTYHANMPREYVPVKENGKTLEVWTGGSRSPCYRPAYTHPKHMVQAVEEVKAYNAEMLRQSDSYYSKPWA